MTTDHATGASAHRRRILDAASREFAEHGFAGARVDEIARRAGINKALLYYHVGNKQAIYTAVLVRNFDRVAKGIVSSSVTGGSASDRLGRLASGIAAVLRDNPDHPRIMLREFASAGENLEPEVLDRVVTILGAVRRLLAEGVDDGELRNTDPVLTHITLIGASLFLAAVAPLRDTLAGLMPEIDFPDENTDSGAFLTDILLRGIANPNVGEST
jgi:AcrR family transcriptional regulator